MHMKKQEYAEDDGRVIADMSLLDNKPARKTDERATKAPGVEMSKAELRSVTLHAVLAGLVIAGIFLAAVALFILFCTNIWFR